MVQYILTPWRHHRDLLHVRRQFYGSSPYEDEQPQSQTSQKKSGQSHKAPQAAQNKQTTKAAQATQAEEDEREDAVARVGIWIQRGNCPHMVESTMALIAAVLSDERAGRSTFESVSVRGAYAMAFSRFVTGLLDSQQDKQRKQSMYTLAKTIGLRAPFVELRHETTHESMPSKRNLREGTKEALKWIWEHYWKQLGDAEGVGDEVVKGVEIEVEQGEDIGERIGAEKKKGEGEEIGWRLLQGPWVPKPIGVV